MTNSHSPETAPQPLVGSPTNGFAIASLVVALTGAGAILAIIFGHIARSQIRKTGQSGAGLALAGLVIGYLEIVAALIIVIIGLVFFAWLS
ncbi:MAG: DUF4190 domain-containing protein [Bifidobacteriaceae bacterium]|jgi:peptidyl-prolyl cis-trans isomerase B (cyclophilin B)|nr:DUF4190 domain-containing protein [Bifidobacteriaceae bacterium]